MKKSYPTVSCILALGFTAVVQAGELLPEMSPNPLLQTGDRVGFYVRGYGGLNWFEDTDSAEFDLGWLAGASVGYQFPDDRLGAFRLELDGNYAETDIDESGVIDGDLGLTSVAINVIHDFNTGTRFSPYLGVGAGAAFINSDISLGGQTLNEDDDAVFLFQFIGGVEFEIDERWSLFTEYRYVGLDDFTLSSGALTLDGDDLAGHQVLIGARFSF